MVVVLLAISLHGTAIRAAAQDPAISHGRLAGRMVDTVGAPLQGGDISVRLIPDASTPSHQSISRHVAAQADGTFEFARLPAGRYVVRALLVGMAPVDDTVAVRGGETTKLQLRMAASIVERHARERRALADDVPQPTLTFTTRDIDPRTCPASREAAVTVQGDTITVTGCATFPAMGHGLKAHVARYGSTLVLDLMPQAPDELLSIASGLTYEARIHVPTRGAYTLHVRMNIQARDLDSYPVARRIVDTTTGTVSR